MDQLPHGPGSPQGEIELHLGRVLVDNPARDLLFLFSGEEPSVLGRSFIHAAFLAGYGALESLGLIYLDDKGNPLSGQA